MPPILSKDNAKNRFSKEKENKLSFLSVRFLFKSNTKQRYRVERAREFHHHPLTTEKYSYPSEIAAKSVSLQNENILDFFRQAHGTPLPFGQWPSIHRNGAIVTMGGFYSSGSSFTMDIPGNLVYKAEQWTGPDLSTVLRFYLLIFKVHLLIFKVHLLIYNF